jgi:hypothetical protein
LWREKRAYEEEEEAYELGAQESVHGHDDLKRLAEALLVRKDAAKAVGVEANVVPNEPNALDLMPKNTHTRTHAHTHTPHTRTHTRKRTFT